MVFANVRKQVVDISSNIGMRGLNPGNDLLRVVNLRVTTRRGILLYLRDDFKPCVHLDSREPATHGVANLIVCAEFEPEGQ